MRWKGSSTAGFGIRLFFSCLFLLFFLFLSFFLFFWRKMQEKLWGERVLQRRALGFVFFFLFFFLLFFLFLFFFSLFSDEEYKKSYEVKGFFNGGLWDSSFFFSFFFFCFFSFFFFWWKIQEKLWGERVLQRRASGFSFSLSFFFVFFFFLLFLVLSEIFAHQKLTTTDTNCYSKAVECTRGLCGAIFAF